MAELRSWENRGLWPIKPEIFIIVHGKYLLIPGLEGVKSTPILTYCCCCSVTQLCLTLWPHGLQHARPPCPSPSSEVYPSSCPLYQWGHPAISSSDTLFSFCPQSFIKDFSNESTVHIRWPKYWSFSFSISPSNEYSGLISLKIDWFGLLAVQGTFRSLLQHQKLATNVTIN